MRNFVRIFLAAVVVAALMPPVPAYATQYETIIDYYTGCDDTFTWVGIADQDCNGEWAYIGDQEGDWKREVVRNCDNNAVVSTTYYHYCNSTWVQINGTSLGACDLDC